MGINCSVGAVQRRQTQIILVVPFCLRGKVDSRSIRKVGSGKRLGNSQNALERRAGIHQMLNQFAGRPENSKGRKAGKLQE